MRCDQDLDILLGDDILPIGIYHDTGGKFECLLLHFGSMFGHDQPCLLMQHHLKVGKNFLDFIGFPAG